MNGQQTGSSSSSTTTTASPPAGGITPASQFDQLAAQASAAREARKLTEASDLYRKALKIRPEWLEGWWYLATTLYAEERFEEAAAGFEKAASLQPEAGAVWGMLGLCEYRLGRYDEALDHIQKAYVLGLATDNTELIRVLRYHQGVLLTYKGQFERAQKELGSLSNDGMTSENLINALGLSILRIPMLPHEIGASERLLVRRAGWAEHLSAQRDIGAAEREYERLVAEYPKTANVQYAYGRFLLSRREDEQAVKAFEREIANSPNHAMARFQIAFVMLNNKQAAKGVEYAKQGVALNPRLSLGRYIYGRLLFDTGENERAIQELETALNLASDEARTYYALSRAYARAKRSTDAERALQEFQRLNRVSEGKDDGSLDAVPDSP